ncbi:AraC family transcriptional regulator [Cupriavidus necator]|uniref:AraC family transcriptional regulator n=2 Tax=Cupriavidus necator TaxID=106590 RepID=A0A1U9UT43_CUPNE|nr:AraC family transcriptional regulator [Cupriavidus necator]
MPLSPRTPALSALYDNPLFRSDVRVEAHDHVARELTDHVLRWKPGAPDVAMFKGELNRVKIYALRYGAEVEISARPFEDFSLVHTSLGAGAEIESDGHRLWVAEGRTAVLAPKERIRLRWSPGNQQMIVRVPHTLLHEAAGREGVDHVDLAPGVLLPRELEPQWDLIAHSLLNVLSCSRDSAVHANWVDHLERSLALFLLLHQPVGTATQPLPPQLASVPGQGEGIAAGRGMRQMDAVMAYIESHLCAPVALEDLARAAGVSFRTLNAVCHRHHGISPMELLRNIRLDAVRTRLLLDPGASITETALALGFGHLGRFAAYYAARFNELPSDTQKRRT